MLPPIDCARQRARDRRQWGAGVEVFHEAASGMMSAEVIRRGQGRIDVAMPLAHWAAQSRAYPGASGCLSCSAPLDIRATLPDAFVIVRTAPEPHSVSIVAGVCHACAWQDDDALLALMFGHMRLIWPDLRLVDLACLHQEGGRA
jgi:hypothetical protein